MKLTVEFIDAVRNGRMIVMRNGIESPYTFQCRTGWIGYVDAYVTVGGEPIIKDGKLVTRRRWGHVTLLLV